MVVGDVRYAPKNYLNLWPQGCAAGRGGVVHHDDLLYLFHDDHFPYFATSDPEYEMVKTLTSMWANCAETGQPIPSGNPKFANVVWTLYNLKDKKYLYIDNQLTIKSNLYADRMAEWERLFPIGNTPAAGTSSKGAE